MEIPASKVRKQPLYEYTCSQRDEASYGHQLCLRTTDECRDCCTCVLMGTHFMTFMICSYTYLLSYLCLPYLTASRENLCFCMRTLKHRKAAHLHRLISFYVVQSFSRHMYVHKGTFLVIRDNFNMAQQAGTLNIELTSP